jgi:hypothetical protein
MKLFGWEGEPGFGFMGLTFTLSIQGADKVQAYRWCQKGQHVAESFPARTLCSWMLHSAP